MNTHFSRFLVATLLVVAGLSFYSFNSATTASAEEQVQEVGKKTKQKLSLAEEIRRFTNALIGLTDVLDKDSGSTPEEGGSPEEFSLQASGGVMANPACLDGWMSFPKSNTFKSDAPWSTALLATGGSTNQPNYLKNQFSDITGDGVPDYLHYDKRPYNYNGIAMNTSKECFLKGTGSGWEPLYRCVATTEYVNGVTHPVFYGDCADLSV